MTVTEVRKVRVVSEVHHTYRRKGTPIVGNEWRNYR